MKDIKILIADDHPIYIEGLSNLLKTYNYEVVAAAGNGAEAVEKALELNPDIILMDADMPVMNGIQATEKIKNKLPDVKIIILTGIDNEESLFGAIKAGASGFLTKDLDGDYLNNSLQELLSGKSPFSPGKQESLLKEFSKLKSWQDEKKEQPLSDQKHEFILKQISSGATYKEIAYDLCISERAVKYHIRKIKDMYNLNSQAQLVHFYNSRKQ